VNQDPAGIPINQLTGRIIGEKYRLDQFIHEGNFGAVFKSTQFFLGIPIRSVAIKICKHETLDLVKAREVFSDVFVLARTMEEIQDPIIRNRLVQIFDSGTLPEFKNRIYMVMEYVQGTTLAAQFSSFRQTPANQLMKWVAQIAETVGELHGLMPPLIHRDLKPNNILLDINNNVKIIDFGLAARLLAEGFVPGTLGPVAYMAPETIRGESVPASDVYSLGILMYEGLTSRHPFAELIPPIDVTPPFHQRWLYSMKEKYRPKPPSFFNNTVSKELDRLILKCLEFRPFDRFYDAKELHRAICELENPGDPVGSISDSVEKLKELLNKKDISVEIRFKTLSQLGTLYEDQGDLIQAADYLEQAWDLTKNRAILRTVSDRVQLLERLEEIYEKSGNRFQMKQYQNLKNSMLGR